jgi:acetate kinase
MFSRFPDQLEKPIWETKIEWKNISDGGSKKMKESLHSLSSEHEIDCIGHRIVHGGKKYHESIVIDANVKKEIQNLSDLAPLHNLADLEGIEILEKMFPKIPQVAVFDTAFHHSLPEAAKIYPGPYEWTQMGIQRYGFHGTSFQYCSRRVKEILYRTRPQTWKYGKEAPQNFWSERATIAERQGASENENYEAKPTQPDSKFVAEIGISQDLLTVICHLGSGASLCAVKNGKSIDTTMGFTPLEGLVMDTRSGSVDPGILLYLMKKKGRTVDELSKELYEQSGLLGLSGITSDMRDILKSSSKGDPRASIAIDVYVHRLTSMISSMAASLGGMEALVFTAGIGENSPQIREKVCKRLAFLGVNLSKDEQIVKEDCIISSASSKVKVLVIHTQEAFEIARECWKKVNG